MAAVRIRNAEALLAALNTGDSAVRLGTLRAVASAPAKALALGTHLDRDIVDELIQQARHETNTLYRKAVLTALRMFQDPRAVAFFKDLLTGAEVPEEVFLAAEQLTAESPEFWLPWLLQDRTQAHARAAAKRLAEVKNLETDACIRIALLTKGTAPPLSPHTCNAWLAELTGVYGMVARRRVEAQGRSALDVLISRWSLLPADLQVWLLRWGGQHWPEALQGCLEHCLASGSDPVILAALQAIAALDKTARPPLSHFLDHPNPAVRSVAIRAGAEDNDWRRRMSEEDEPQVLASWVERLTQEQGPGALTDLLEFLAHSQQAVRSAAISALISLGEDAAGATRPLLRHADLTVRIGAVQVLLALGKDTWLQSELLPTLEASPFR